MTTAIEILKARAAARDVWLDNAKQILTGDVFYAAAWLVGSFARGEADEWSDVDLVVVVEASAASSAKTDQHLSEFGMVRSAHEGPNAPPGGRFVSVVYSSPVGPINVDWTWASQATAAVPSEALVIVNDMGIERSTLTHSELVTPAPYVVPDDPVRAVEDQLRFFWAMMPIVAKYLARGWDDSVVSMLQMLQRSVVSVAMFCQEDVVVEVNASVENVLQMMALMEGLMKKAVDLGASESGEREQAYEYVELAGAVLSDKSESA